MSGSRARPSLALDLDSLLFRRCAILLYHSPFDLRAQIELQYQVSMEISPDSIMTSARPAYDRNFLEVDAFHRACPVVSH